MIAEKLFDRSQGLSTYSNPEPWFIHWLNGGETSSGIAVNERTALTLSAVWGATRFLTSKLAGLPCILYKERGEGDRERDLNNPLYGLLKDVPAPGYDAFLWWEMQWAFLINWGNAWAEIIRLPDGTPVQLWPIHPNRVNAEKRSNGSWVFHVHNDDGTVYDVEQDDMLNIVGPLSEDGVIGKGVIRQARESIGLGKATEKFGAQFFGNGAMPGIALIHKMPLKEEAKENIRKGWSKRFSADGQRGIAVLAEDMKLEQFGIPPEDGQFLETRQFNVTDIARWYGVPPHCIGDLTHATFSNIEEQNINVVVDSLTPWCIRAEKSLKRQLLPPETNDLYWEFLVDAMLRGNAKSRGEGRQIQFMNGAITLNEWRKTENLPRIPGEAGDKHFVPVNVVPIEIALNPPEPAPAAAPGGKKPQQPSGGKPLAVLWQREWARLTLIESKKLRQLAKTPKVFLQQWGEFLAQHEGAIIAALEPLIALYPSAFPALGGRAEDFARDEILWLESETAVAAECQPRELSNYVESFIAHKLTPRRQEPIEWLNN